MNDVPIEVPIGVPIEIPIGVPIAVREHKRFPTSDGPSPSGRTRRPPRPPRPTPRDLILIHDVQRLGQVSAGQLTRLHFADHSPQWRGRRCNKALARLLGWGKLSRIESGIGGFRGGSTGCIYLPPCSTARIPDPHTLDIAELYVRLMEQQRAGAVERVRFTPEPYSYDQIGNVELKPDATADLTTPSGRYRWWLEVDRGTEWGPRLHKKMRLYVDAFRHWPLDKTFPTVLFVVPDAERARVVRGVAKHQDKPQLFVVCQFEDAIPLLTR
jgi:Replication-relaxation